MWRPGLGLRRDAMRGGLLLRLGGGLHAGGRARVRRLGLRPRRGLRGPDLTAERPRRAQPSLTLEVWVGGLRHLLLGAQRAAVLGWGASTEVLLLQEPLVDGLLEHGLGCLGLWGPPSALLGLHLPGSTLSRLQRRPPWSSTTPSWPSVLPLQPTH